MSTALLKVGRLALHHLLPPRCAACGEDVMEGDLCAACFGDLHFLGPPCCVQCGLPFPYDTGLEGVCGACAQSPPRYARARAAVSYGEVSRSMVLGLKHGDRTDRVPVLAKLMARAGSDLLDQADFLVPVPLHWTRLVHRRFNQSAELARRLGHMTEKPVLVDGLKRRRKTPSQGRFGRRARLRNVAGAFSLTAKTRDRIKGKRLLLIDDVFTTGATVEACTKVLLRGGAAQIDVLTFARVITEE
ncbi:MAG: ComF family protein [Magnetovibrionaceae bacterium]